MNGVGVNDLSTAEQLRVIDKPKNSSPLVWDTLYVPASGPSTMRLETTKGALCPGSSSRGWKTYSGRHSPDTKHHCPNERPNSVVTLLEVQP